MAAAERVIAATKDAERARLAGIHRVALNLKGVEDGASKLERGNRLRVLAVESKSEQQLRSSDEDVDNAPPRHGEFQ